MKPEQIATPEFSGAEILLQCLVAEGVDTLFGYPGGAIMPVYDALFDYGDRLNHILVRHEQGAIHAAQGFARASGRVGVAFATSGPGATNLITGLADALIDSTPVVCITGQVFAHLLGTDAFQEIDVVNTTIPVTKWNVQVTEAKDIAEAVAKAFYIARTGRPGPVLIDITKNAQNEKIAFAGYQPCTSIRTYKPKPELPQTQVMAAAMLINEAKRPYLLAGQGILLSGATDQLVAFSEKTGIPVACTLLGLSGFPIDHPNYVGFLGMHGNYAANVNINECDLLIGIGMRFDDRVTGNVNKFAKEARIIHIDIDRAEINKIVRADVAIHADAAEALTVLTHYCHRKTHSAWRDSFTTLAHVEEKIVARHEHDGGRELTMAEVIHALASNIDPNTIIATDVGQHQMVASRFFPYRTPRTNITSGGAGTMGFALPAAIGAQLAKSDRQVIAIVGDGGFQMTMQELGTIMQYRIPVKILILNNGYLGMVRQWQELFHQRRYSFTDLANPDFAAVAAAYGIEAKRIERREELPGAIHDLLAAPSSFLLEVHVIREENVFPMVPAGAGVSDMLLEAPAKKEPEVLKT